MHGSGYDPTVARLLMVYKDHNPELIAEDFDIRRSQLPSVCKVRNREFDFCYMLNHRVVHQPQISRKIGDCTAISDSSGSYFQLCFK